MALTLGVSVGNALTAGSGSTCTSSSGVLSICASNSDITTAPSGDKSQDLGITWQGVDSQTQAYIPSLNGGSTAIENLNFKFSDSAPLGNGVIGKGTSSGSTLNIDVKKSQSVVVLIKGNQKGLQIGSTGTGTMTIDFGIGSDTARDFTLDLSDTSAGDFSYKGNLVVKAGKGYLDTGSSTFNGYFKKAFIGNITLERTESGNAGWAKNNFTFDSGIQGNISTKVGTNTITFNDGNLEGSISALNSGESFANPVNHITFAKTASITGDISASSGPWILNPQNNITFKANGTIGSSSRSSTITSIGGNNTITFVEDGTIYANLQSTRSNAAIVGTNTINFQGTGTNTINGNITGNSAKNTISFTGANSTNTIVGNLSAGTTDRGGAGENTITAKNSGGSVDLTINGNIFTESGTNSITVENGTLTIKKADAASSDIVIKGNGGLAGKNTISAKTLKITVDKIEASRDNMTGNSNYQNSITATEDSAHSTLTATNGIVAKNSLRSENSNTIDIKQGTLTINAGGIEGSNGGNNTITAGVMNITGDIAVFGGYTSKNSLTLTGSSDSNISGKLSAVGQYNVKDSQNTLKINGTGKLTISGGIEARSNGINSITLTNGSLETSSITTTSGSNTINSTTAGSVTLTGGIDNNAGTTSIITTGTGTFTLDNSNATISTYGGVTANTKIQSKGALTLTLKSLQVNSDGNSTNTNTIIAEAQGGNTIKITDGIQTNHGKGITNLAINGNSSDTTSSSLTANIINSGSTNIILQDSTWAPSSLKKTIDTPTNSGTLTNNSGTTNLVIRTTGAINQNGNIPIYNVNANGGNTNIAMQGDTSAVANLNYGGGKATLIFASSNDSATDSFASGSTNLSANKVLGKIYQDGVKLTLHDYNVAIQDTSKSLIDTFGDHFRNADGALLTLDVARTSSADTIKIDGLIAGDISSLGSSSNKEYVVELSNKSAFVGSLGIISDKISLTMDADSKLVIVGGKETAHAKLSTLNIKATNFDASQTMNPIFDQTNTVINLATGVNDVYNAPNREDFRLLEIGTKSQINANTGFVSTNGTDGTKGILFQVYVNNHAGSGATLGGKTKNEWNGTNYGEQYSADRIVIHNAGDNSQASTHHLQIVYDGQTKIDNIKYTSGGTEVASNIAVATVVNKSGTNGAQSGQASTNGVLNFALQNTLQGFDEIVSTLVGVYTDEYGKTSGNGSNTYTTYFVNNARSAGASEANREATATAFGVNYDLYMANFNSLNKRMGELRDNPHSQGAWIRIFNGSQTNDMGLGTKSNYTTFQGGYDYAFGMEGANNYLGLAIAYGLSDSKIQSSMADLNGSQRGVENIKSNAVEVAVYNSYVQDEGWYNDTIAKFSYIFSDFNMMEQSQTYSTSNMAFTLSDEFGYRFKLGENKEWTIDPQLEVAYGYFDQSDFVQKLGVATLDSTLESITTLRTRVGSSFGYNFKNFTANKPIKASVYLGTFYEFDYISGGDITMTTNLGSTNSINSLSSDGRVVMNVGTNVEIYDNTRIYFDFEKSFGGSITTDYQVNLGVRYSFGESNGYTPAVAKAKEVAPLKVEEVKNTQENQAQESKTTQESR